MESLFNARIIEKANKIAKEYFKGEYEPDTEFFDDLEDDQETDK